VADGGPAVDGGSAVLDGGSVDGGAPTGCQAYDAAVCFDFDALNAPSPVTMGTAYSLTTAGGGYSPPNAAMLADPATFAVGMNTFLSLPTASQDSWSTLSFQIKVGADGNAFVIATTRQPTTDLVATCGDSMCQLSVRALPQPTPAGSFSRGTFHEIRVNRTSATDITISVDGNQTASLAGLSEDINPLRFQVGVRVEMLPAPTRLVFDDIWFK